MISPTEPIYAQTDPDVRLMLEVRGGSVTAFEQLVRRHEGRVLMVLQLLTGNGHLAEDLSQEVFLRVFRSRHGYSPTAKFTTWLFVIVNNVVSNAKRDRARKPVITMPDRGGNSPLDQLVHRDAGETPAGRLERDELRDAVRLAVQQLCARQRQAVMLQKFQCMRYDQIAETMNTSPKAVKSLLARARTRLRQELRPYVSESQATSCSNYRPTRRVRLPAAPTTTRLGESGYQLNTKKEYFQPQNLQNLAVSAGFRV